MARDRWTSRTTFLLGAIGSAVGLGNLWRFPFLVFDWGGGTFLIPYVVTLFFFGIPLLLMEVTLGRQFQGGDPVCFASMHPRLVGIGWMSAYGSFLLSVYYPVLIGWIVIFFFNSFKSPLPWALKGNNGTDALDGAILFFVNDVIKDSGSIAVQESFNPWVIVATTFVWVCSYFSIWKGVKVVSQVVKISVPLPLITLFVLLFNSIGRDGAGDGVKAYIGNWDFSVMGDPQIWQAAVGQVFFSIGVCFGIMTAYSSYMESRKGLFMDSLTIALVDTAISFFAGFTVFTAVGVLANDLGLTVNDPNFAALIGGARLVFIAYPAALDGLETAPQIFSIIFFLTVFFLAIDSAFSLVEAVVASIYDTNTGRSIPREKIVLAVSVLGYLFGIFICLDNGSYWLDLVDYYLNNFIMLGVGALECMASMWVYGFADSSKELGEKPMLVYNIGYLLSVLVSSVFFISLEYNNILMGFLIWPLIASVSFVAAMVMSEPMPNKLYKLAFSGGASKMIEIMATNQYDTMDNLTVWYSVVLHVWAVMCKYLIPQFLTILMITGAKANFEDPFGGFDPVFQNVGNFEVMVGWLILFAFMFIKIDVYSDRVAEHMKRVAERVEHEIELEEDTVKEVQNEKEELASTPIPAAMEAEVEVKETTL